MYGILNLNRLNRMKPISCKIEPSESETKSGDMDSIEGIDNSDNNRIMTLLTLKEEIESSSKSLEILNNSEEMNRFLRKKWKSSFSVKW